MKCGSTSMNDMMLPIASRSKVKMLKNVLEALQAVLYVLGFIFFGFIQYSSTFLSSM